MAAIISIQNIQQVVSSLPYPSAKSLKSRLVHAVMQFYNDAESVRTLQTIPADALIQTLWSTGDNPEIIRKKQKNLSSVRSSVNIDLKKLASDGKNPDGLQLSHANIFVMSEEAKDKALDAILDKMPGDTPASLDEIAKVLQMVDGMLSNLEANRTVDADDRQLFVTEMKTVIDEITKKVSSDGFLSDGTLGDGGEGQTDVGQSGSGNPAGDVEATHTGQDENVASVGGESVSGSESTGAGAENLAGSGTAETDPDAAEGHPDREVGKGTIKDGSDLVAKADKSNGTQEKNGNAIGETDAGGEEHGSVELDKSDVLDDGELPLGVEDEGSEKQGYFTGDPAESNSDQARGLGRGDDGVEGGSANAIDPEVMPIDDDELEDLVFADDGDTFEEGDADTFDDDHVDTIDDDDVDPIELDEPERVDDIHEEEMELVDHEELLDSTVDGGQTDMDGSGDADGAAGTGQDKDPQSDRGDPDAEQYSGGDVADQLPPEHSSADNGLDRVEAIGVEDMPDWSQNPQKARFLAEEFNRSLAAMDKFYNQYIMIPKGEYVVGCPQSKGKQNPEKAIQLPEFYIGKFPVTNALFELFIEKTGYQTTAEKQGFGTVYTGRSQHIIDPQTGQEHKIWHADIQCQTVAGACWYQPRGPGSTIHKKRNHPVVQVSLQDAMAFAAWTGKRLPSEAEWEAAARTTDSRVYPWGNAWQIHGCNIEESGISDTTPVDNYLDFINNFGVADSLGNTLEWTSCTANGNSKGDKNAYYVVKGGSWISGPDIGLYSQFQQTSDGHSNLLGFRCVAF